MDSPTEWGMETGCRRDGLSPENFAGICAAQSCRPFCFQKSGQKDFGSTEKGADVLARGNAAGQPKYFSPSFLFGERKNCPRQRQKPAGESKPQPRSFFVPFLFKEREVFASKKKAASPRQRQKPAEESKPQPRSFFVPFLFKEREVFASKKKAASPWQRQEPAGEANPSGEVSLPALFLKKAGETRGKTPHFPRKKPQPARFICV